MLLSLPSLAGPILFEDMVLEFIFRRLKADVYCHNLVRRRVTFHQGLKSHQKRPVVSLVALPWHKANGDRHQRPVPVVDDCIGIPANARLSFVDVGGNKDC